MASCDNIGERQCFLRTTLPRHPYEPEGPSVGARDNDEYAPTRLQRDSSPPADKQEHSDQTGQRSVKLQLRDVTAASKCGTSAASDDHLRTELSSSLPTITAPTAETASSVGGSETSSGACQDPRAVASSPKALSAATQRSRKAYRIKNPKTKMVEYNPNAPQIRAYRIRSARTNSVEHNPWAPRLRGRLRRKSAFLTFVVTLGQFVQEHPAWAEEHAGLMVLLSAARLECKGCGAQLGHLLVFYHPRVCKHGGPLVLTLKHCVAVQQLARVSDHTLPTVHCTKAVRVVPEQTRYVLQGLRATSPADGHGSGRDGHAGRAGCSHLFGTAGHNLLCSLDKAKALFAEAVETPMQQE
eukprot:m.174043 g.174043  ORF g.174043 m.174043 type:complete len:355 (-) comp17884_c1_seq1:391-1455(-)